MTASPSTDIGQAGVGDPIIYTTSWCGFCRRLKSQLDAAGTGYREVDIEQVPEAAEIVTTVNGGNRTVPTVVFADGTAMTNPSAATVQHKLSDLRTG